MKKNNYAVVEVISVVISVFMILTIISAIMLWGVPYMEEIKAKAIHENVYSKLSAASECIDDIVHETSGSSRSYTFEVNDGTVDIDSVGDRFVVSYSLVEGWDFTVVGLDDDDENFDVIFHDSHIPDPLKVKVYQYPNDPIIMLNPCEDVSLVDLAGNTCSCLKFDITPLYEIEHPIKIVSVKLRLKVSDEVNIFNGLTTDVRFSQINNQRWDESWSCKRLSSIPVLQHRGNAVFFFYSNYIESSNILNVFLEDYESKHQFCSFRIEDPVHKVVQPAFTIDHTLLSIGSIFNHCSFYSHETDLFMPELIINYIPLEEASSSNGFTGQSSQSKNLDKSDMATLSEGVSFDGLGSLSSDVEKKAPVVVIVDKQEDHLDVLPGERFYVERTIDGPPGQEVTLVSLFSEQLIFEKIEIAELQDDILVWSSAVDSRMCEVSAVSTGEEIAVNQVLEKLPQDMQTFKRFAYTEAFEIDGATQVRFWFKAPSWEEIKAGTYPSGRISYLVLSDDTFDFEGSTKWKSGWQYRRQITIDSGQVAEDYLSNFPILVHVDGDTPGTVMNDLKNYAEDDGDDIAFTSKDGATPLFHEIELFDSDSGELIAWVNVPNLMHSQDTILYMYYGNPDCADQWNIIGTWESNFQMVQHLEETSDPHEDSTSYNNDGNESGGVNQSATGKIDGADWFDGSDDYIDCGTSSSLNITGDITLEAWVKDPPRFSSEKSRNPVTIVDKKDEHLTIPQGNTFIVKRTVSAAPGAEMVFAALYSPGIHLLDMNIDGVSIFAGTYPAGRPTVTDEQKIENIRTTLPEKVQNLQTVAYSQPFTIQSETTITMVFLTEQWYLHADGKISYLVLSSEGSYDYECTTHWHYPALIDWFNPLSLFRNVDSNINRYYNKKTQIFTEKGDKYFYQLNDEKVGVLNPSMQEFEWQTPLNRVVYDHDEEIYRIETENSSLLGDPTHKGYVYVIDENKNKDYSTPKICNNCLGEKTSTTPCFLSPLSPENIGQLNFNANARYGESLKFNSMASGNLSEKLEKEINFICFLINKKASNNSSFVNLVTDNNLSVLFCSSENKNSGAMNSKLRSFLLCSNTLNEFPLLIKAENTTFTSTTRSIYFPFFNNFSYLLANDKFTSSASFLACSSVNLDLATIFRNLSTSFSCFNFFNVSCLAISDQLIQDNLSIMTFNSLDIFNVTLTNYTSPLFIICSNFSNAFALFFNRAFNTSGQLISGYWSILFFNSLGIDTVNVGMLLPPDYLQHVVNIHYIVSLYKFFVSHMNSEKDLELIPITEAYGLINDRKKLIVIDEDGNETASRNSGATKSNSLKMLSKRNTSTEVPSLKKISPLCSASSSISITNNSIDSNLSNSFARDELRIVDKHNEHRVISPAEQFTVKRTVAANSDSEVVFAALLSPGVRLIDMTIEGSSVFAGIYDAGMPISKEEQDIENIRKKLPDKLKKLETIAYSKPFRIQDETTIQMQFSTEEGYKLFSDGEISHLLISADGKYDYECTTHWHYPVLVDWFNPFSIFQSVIDFFTGGDNQDSSDDAVSDSGTGVPIIDADKDSVSWENGYARLEVYPHTSRNIARQVQYANVTWKAPTADIDLAFRFDDAVSKPNIWIERYMPHQVKVRDYGWINSSYTIYNITEYTVVDEPDGVYFGDMSSNTYVNVTTTWDGMYEMLGRNWALCGFDSYQELDDTTIRFNYTYRGVTGHHYETQYWWDWVSLKDKFHQTNYQGKKYYYVSNVKAVQGESYQFKWEYHVPPNSKGKWELFAKLHSDTIQEALDSGRYVMIDPWWSSSWAYRKLITINSSKVEEDLTNFPVLVYNSSDNDLAARAQSDGDDIAFIDWSDNTTQFNHEIELFNGTTGELWAWVNVTSLNSTSDTKIWMYYGNSSCGSQENVAGTWDSNYTLVQHLQETGDGYASEYVDSTSYDNDGQGGGGTSSNVPIFNSSGKIDGANDFTNSSNYIQYPWTDSLNISGAMTVEAWVYPIEVPTGTGRVITATYDWDPTAENIRGWYLGCTSGSSDVMAFVLYNSAGDGCGAWYTGGFWANNLNQWSYVVGTFDPSNYANLYVNTDLKTQDTSNIIGSVAYTSLDLTIGRRADSTSGEWNGTIDEVRISNIVRNNSWLGTCYNNTNDTSTFLSFGGEDGMNTSVDAISPYEQASSPLTITATSSGTVTPDNVTLYYRWSNDNSSWGEPETGYKVQRGYYTMGASNTKGTVTIDAVDTDNAFVLCYPYTRQYNLTSSGTLGGTTAGDPSSMMATAYLKDSTTVEFERDSHASKELLIDWQVLECYDEEFTVQRGETSFSSLTDTYVEDTIPTAVTPANSMAWHTMRTSSTSNDGRVIQFLSNVTDSTTINLTRTGTTVISGYFRWIVVEWNTSKTHVDSFQMGDLLSPNEVDSNYDSTPKLVTLETTIDASDSILLFQSRAKDDDGLESSTTAGYIKDEDEIGFYEYDTTLGSAEIHWYVIDFGDYCGSNQSNSHDLNTDIAWNGENYTLSPAVNTSRALTFVSMSANGDGTAKPRHTCISNLTSGTILNTSRRYTAIATEVSWQVLEIPYNASLTYGANGTNWIQWSDASNPDTAGPWSWEFNFPNSTGYYEFYSIGNISGYGNESAPSTADARCNYTYISDSTPPNITINFAGNLSDSGGPYWRPPGESTQLTGVWSDGYYTNDSRQQEDWIYINLTVNDSESSIDDVWLQWLNETTWTNWTYEFTNTAGDYYEYNTSGNITNIGSGYNYSFNIVANDTVGNSNTTWWNKTGVNLNGGYTRRYVQLNYSQVNITYANQKAFYLYDTSYGDDDRCLFTNDYGPKDRLHHDQGADATLYDTGYLLDDIPLDNVEIRYCTDFTGYWFDESICISPFSLNNIYVHVWMASSTDTREFNFADTRQHVTLAATNPEESVSINKGDNRSTIVWDGAGHPGSPWEDKYYLQTKLMNINPVFSYTDNDIYEIVVEFNDSVSKRPSTISNRSIISFALFNVPDNDTLNASYADSDSDSLSDWTELYVTYTNPFLADTDNDGMNDYWENQNGSDPNNYTDINYGPTISNENPGNSSTGINRYPACNVTVSDTEGSSMTVYFYENTTGSWVLQQTNNSVASGSNVVWSNYSNASGYVTTYWWSVNVTDSLTWTNQTYSFTTRTGNKQVISKGRSAYSLEINQDADTIYGYINTDHTVQTSIDTNWHYAALTFNGNTLTLYKDGESKDTTSWSGSIPTNANNLILGKNLSGKLDELRISSTARSAAWINTTYLNTNDPTTFATFGTQRGVLSTWTYRKKITINSSMVNATLTNFPLLVYNASDSNLAEHVLSTGNDIIFVNSSVEWTNGTWRDKLNHEIELYNGTTGELVAWVNVTSVSSSTNTEIYMYYGNTLCPTNRENATGVWNSDYKAVYHLGEEYALDFDGSDDYISIGSDPSIDFNVNNQYTYSFWLYLHEQKNNVIFEDAKGGDGGVYLFIDDSGNYMAVGHQLDVLPEEFISSTAVSLNTWHEVTFVYTDSNSWDLYLDGTFEENLATSGLVSSSFEKALGCYSTDYFNGTIDEARIYNRALSASEISDSYHGRPVSRTGLVAEYLMDEGSGNTVSDSSGQGNNGDRLVMWQHGLDPELLILQ